MATEKEIDEMLAGFDEPGSYEFFKHINDSRIGMIAVLRLLEEHGSLAPGAISKKLGISTARVAALLNKLEAKGLICRRHKREDARKLEVILTEKGFASLKARYNEIRSYTSIMLDAIGIDTLRQYNSISKQIHDVFEREIRERLEETVRAED